MPFMKQTACRKRSNLYHWIQSARLGQNVQGSLVSRSLLAYLSWADRFNCKSTLKEENKVLLGLFKKTDCLTEWEALSSCSLFLFARSPHRKSL